MARRWGSHGVKRGSRGEDGGLHDGALDGQTLDYQASWDTRHRDKNFLRPPARCIFRAKIRSSVLALQCSQNGGGEWDFAPLQDLNLGFEIEGQEEGTCFLGDVELDEVCRKMALKTW